MELKITSAGTSDGTSQDVHSFAPPVEYDPGLQGKGFTEFLGQKYARGHSPLQLSSIRPGFEPYVPPRHGCRTPFWQ